MTTPIRDGQPMPKGMLLKTEPAVRRPDWLPQGIFEELDPLAEFHRARIAELEEARAEAQALGHKYRAEDEARQEAYKTGLKTPTMTDPAQRDRETAAAKARVEAAEKAMEECVEQAVCFVQEAAEDWRADLERQAAEALERRAEAERILEQTDEDVRRLKQVRRWLRRTADNRFGRHTSLAALGMPEPERPLSPAAWAGEIVEDPSPPPADAVDLRSVRTG